VTGARAVCAALASMASTAGMLLAFDGTAAATTVTATLFVADGATGTCTQTSPCGSIQTAVSEGEGYIGEAVTVHVGPGTYSGGSGGITVSAGSLASLTIEGSGAANTKVTGTFFYRDFLVSAGTVSIDDLTVMNASETTGAGVFNEGTLTLARDTFSGNIALNVGGAICNTGTLVAIDDYFTDDSATYGGDVYNSHTATFMATEDTFAGNLGTATFGGGMVNAGTLTATDDTFIGEIATNGGGIYNVGTLTATDDTFSRNTAYIQGGAIQNVQGSVTATNDTFFQNSAGTTTATVLNADGTFTATDDTFSTGNQTGMTVGSIATEHGTFTATDSIFYGIRCFAVTAAVVSSAYNVVTDQCGLLGSPVSASAFDLSPNLQSTPSAPTAPATLSLGPRSAAVDVVPSSACTVTVDERGDHRPGVTGQTSCDAGAYELQGTGKAPSIVSADHATFAVEEAGTFQVEMAPGVFPTPDYSLTGAPSWVSMTSASGTITGTPPTGTGGTYSFTVKASNGITPAASQVFTLSVDQPPAITSADHAAFTVGEPGSFQVAVTAHTFPTPPTYTETGTLPGGVTLSRSGLLSGTPPTGTGGTYSFTVKASNGITPAASQVFTLSVDQPPAIGVHRVYGQTASATAAAELESAFPAGAGRCPGRTATRPVVLATDTTYPDALSSAYLAGSLRTGTLLTATGALPAATLGALRTEGITRVVVAGGPLAVSTAVVAALSRTPAYACGGTTPLGTDITVTRLYGQTEYATARVIALDPALGPVGTADLSGAYAGTDATGGHGAYDAGAGNASSSPSAPGALPTAVLATGTGFQDAESASVLSYTDHLPILLTTPTSLSATAATAIRSLHVAQVIVMGGPLAISDAVVSQLEAMGVSVLRVAGATASATGIELAQAELGSSGSHLGFGWAPAGALGVARGDYWSDGLAGAGLLARAGAGTRPVPLVLTESPSVPGTVLTGFLAQVGASGIDHDEHAVTSLTVVGGPLAVTPQAVIAMVAALER
jgi:putative cell wall-binding protein